MWETDRGTGCGVRIRGVNGRAGFEGKIRASDVGLDGEGGKRDLVLDRGMWKGYGNVVGISVRCRWNVGGTSVECRVQRKGGIGDMTGM